MYAGLFCAFVGGQLFAIERVQVCMHVCEFVISIVHLCLHMFECVIVCVLHVNVCLLCVCSHV